MSAQTASNVSLLFPKADLTLRQKFTVLREIYARGKLVAKYNYKDFVETVILKIADISGNAFENQAVIVVHEGKPYDAILMEGIAYVAVDDDHVVALEPGQLDMEWEDTTFQDLMDEATEFMFDGYLALAHQGRLI